MSIAIVQGADGLDHKQPGQGRLGRVLTVETFYRKRVKAKRSCVLYSSGAKRHKGQFFTRRSRDGAGCGIETQREAYWATQQDDDRWMAMKRGIWRPGTEVRRPGQLTQSASPERNSSASCATDALWMARLRLTAPPDTLPVLVVQKPVLDAASFFLGTVGRRYGCWL